MLQINCIIKQKNRTLKYDVSLNPCNYDCHVFNPIFKIANSKMSKDRILFKNCYVENELYNAWITLLDNFSQGSTINYLQEYYSFQSLTKDEVWNKFGAPNISGIEESDFPCQFFIEFLVFYSLHWANDITCIEYENDDFGIKGNPNINTAFLSELIKQAKKIEEFFLDENITFEIDDERALFHLNFIVFLKKIHENLIKQQYTMLFLNSGDNYEVFYCKVEMSQIISKYLSQILAIEESDILNMEQFYLLNTKGYEKQCNIIAQSYIDQSIISLHKLKK